MNAALDPVALNRLKWRCRRGLLENDLLIDRFFARHGSCITQRQADGLAALMDLPDNDLLDLLLARCQPAGGLDRPPVHEVLALMRPAGPGRAPVPRGGSSMVADPHGLERPSSHGQ